MKLSIGSTPKGLLLVALCLVAAGCGPLGPIPGGRLSGEVGPDRIDDWSFARDEKTAELETRPSEPHSVHTWFVALGPDLYVPTSMIRGPKSPSERSWVAHVEESPEVRIRLAGRVFERVARRVEDPVELARARNALESKYGIEQSERDPDRIIWIFRLDPRGDGRPSGDEISCPRDRPGSLERRARA